MEIWVHPDCSKCRAALSLLDAEGAGAAAVGRTPDAVRLVLG